MRKSNIAAVLTSFVLVASSLMSVTPSGAVGTKLYSGKEWKKILSEAKGQTVNWYMWGGGAKINTYVNDYLGEEAKKYGITLNQVKLNATPEAVNKVLGEKQAGNDKNGSVDLIWINGNNFATGVQADIWHCDWSTKLPNTKYVNWNSSAVNQDFGLPVNGCESPWATASSGVVYDSKYVKKSNLASAAAFTAWVKKNPGKFTYPAPPDFNGSMTVRRFFYQANGGYNQFLGKFDQAIFDSAMNKTASLLNEIEPYLWRKGATYPATIGDVQKLFATGEISAYLDYGARNAFIEVNNGLYPDSTRVGVFGDGMIGNLSYVTIPYNSPRKAGAQVIANLMLAPQAQMKLQTDGIVGLPAINMNITPISGPYRSLPISKHSLSPTKLAKKANPEISADWVNAIDSAWKDKVQK